jgi:hypothetical protein
MTVAQKFFLLSGLKPVIQHCRYVQVTARFSLNSVGGDLPPPCRTKVMEQSPLISENSGYETIQIYR